jgi:hypothetical protein
MVALNLGIAKDNHVGHAAQKVEKVRRQHRAWGSQHSADSGTTLVHTTVGPVEKRRGVLESSSLIAQIDIAHNIEHLIRIGIQRSKYFDEDAGARVQCKLDSQHPPCLPQFWRGSASTTKA